MKKLKVGLVGASTKGGWSPVAHIPALKALEKVELAALCTRSPESAKAASEAFNIDRVYHDIAELVNQADLDIISCVVKIPNHYDVVKSALDAGKHVYCEWPLGATLAETQELAMLASEKGLTTAIGLQGHRSPELLYLKELVQDGWFGQILNVRMTLQSKTSAERASRKAWEEEKHRKATLFSIVGGHTLYYLMNVLGAIKEVSGSLSTQMKKLYLKESDEVVSNEVPDQILINGIFRNEVPFSVQLTAVTRNNYGWKLEIYGTEGSMIATSPVMPQITPIALMGSKGNAELAPIPVPEKHIKFDYLPGGPAGNVGRNYGALAEAIINGESFHPNFNDALAVHSLLNTIEQSSKEKRTVRI